MYYSAVEIHNNGDNSIGALYSLNGHTSGGPPKRGTRYHVAMKSCVGKKDARSSLFSNCTSEETLSRSPESLVWRYEILPPLFWLRSIQNGAMRAIRLLIGKVSGVKSVND